MASELVNHVTDANFDQEVLKSDKAVLIDFWAPWCAPCRAIAPLIDELAGEYAGRLKVVKINVDDNPETPARYGVRGIPNLLIVKNGQVKEQIVGAVPKSHLVRAVDSALVEHPPGLLQRSVCYGAAAGPDVDSGGVVLCWFQYVTTCVSR
jgi:thioredoxin 1